MRIFILNIFFICSFNLISQENYKIRFDHITVEDGLSQNTINCMLQDHRGFMWFGTWDGLNRYDGYDFKVYKNDPKDSNSISHNAITCIYQDKNNEIWIGTEGGGLNRYDWKTDRFIKYYYDEKNPASLPNDKVKAILEDSYGDFWIATRGGGLCKLDRESEEFKVYKADNQNPNSLSYNDIWTLFEDSRRKLWIGTFSGGVMTYNREKDNFLCHYKKMIGRAFVYNNFLKNMEGYVIRNFEEDKEGNIWIGTFHNGLYKYNVYKDTLTNYRADVNNPYALQTDRVEDVLVDSRGEVWIGTYSGGLYKYNKKADNFIVYKSNENDIRSLSGDRIWCLLEDKTGVIWVGTSGGGGNKFYPEKKKFFSLYHDPENPDKSIPHNTLNSLARDKHNNIWIGTENGIAIIKNQTKEVIPIYPQPDQEKTLRQKKIWTMNFIGQDQLVIGYDDVGVDLITVNDWDWSNKDVTQCIDIQKYQKENFFTSGHALYLVKDSKDWLWFSTWDAGVIRLKTTFFKGNENPKIQLFAPHNPKFKISDNTGFHIFEDSKQNIWIGTKNGLNVINLENDSITIYLSDPYDTNSLSSSTVYYCFEDKKGTMWFGTGMGLNKFDSQKRTFKSFSKKDGFPSNLIFGIEEDDHDNLWLSSDYGLVRFSTIDNSFKSYSEEDGLISSSFATRGVLKDDNGELFFANSKGLVYFYPDSIKSNPVIPEIVITDFQIFNKPVMIGKAYNGKIILEKDINDTKVMILSYKHNVFSFSFSSLDYVAPERNKFAYMMEGFDANWIYTNSMRRFVTYTNLNPGTYTFRIKGTNNDGIWNEEGVELKIIIVPPFYKTWWFISLLSILFLVSIFLFIRQRLISIKEEKEYLENKIQEAVSEVENQKEELMKKNEELVEREKEEEKLNWFNEGVARIGDILTREKQNLDKLLNHVIMNLVQYIGANQGCVTLLNDDNPDDVHLEIVAGYALSKEKIRKRKILIGEGQIGAVFMERKYNYINDLPADYTNISSGLGVDSPKHLLLVPLKYDEFVLGVIEIASFKKINDFTIEFVQKVAENITSTLYVLKSTEKTNLLYKQSLYQAEQLKQQEEELRQNLEEMQASQEEMEKHEDQLKQLVHDLRMKIASLETENAKLKSKKS